MRIISRPRQGGKTSQAVEWVQAHPDRVLLVINEQERRRLIREFGLMERQILVADGAYKRTTGRRLTGVGVDNIDMLGWRTVLELGRTFRDIEIVTETRGQ